MVVDELAPVVTVDTKDRKRELGNDVFEGLEHPDLRLVLHRSVDGPTGGNVSNRKGEAELATGVAALVADQVDLHEPRQILAPLGPGADRDLGLEQRARLGVGASPEGQGGPIWGQQAVDG